MDSLSLRDGGGEIPQPNRGDGEGWFSYKRRLFTLVSIFVVGAFSGGFLIGYKGPAEQVKELTEQVTALKTSEKSLEGRIKVLKAESDKYQEQLRKATAPPRNKKKVAAKPAVHHRRK